jgi:hypothetical protein
MKKMSTIQLIELMVNAQVNQEPALRDIAGSLNDEGLKREIELDSIDASTVSRRLRGLATKELKSLFKNLVIHFGVKDGFANLEKQLGSLYLIDSTTISLCLTKYPWAEFRKTKSGIKAHLRLRFSDEGSIPDDMVFTPAKRSDRSQMDQLVVDETGALNVFDRGYNDYKKFDEYSKNGILFVTRLKSNAIIEYVADNPISPGSVIDKDQTVRLGGEGRNRMQHDLRLIETKDTEGNRVLILTNDFERSAEEIGDIYRHRWQIEIFFKWLKQHLTVKHLYSTGYQAVENQIFIALITYCLLALLKLETGFNGSLRTLQRLLKTCLYETFDSFLRKLFKEKRKSKGRKKIDHQQIFEAILRQVITGEADHLDDLSFCPVIL